MRRSISTRVELEHSRDHHLDCVDCIAGGDPMQALDLAIELVGDLTEPQRAKLMEIAGKCPVHKTLAGKLHIHATQIA